MKRIYVIIVTWNGMKWIEKCFDALRDSTIPVEIVVVDNGSTDSTVSFIQENCPEAFIIQTGKNLGFGQANNVGIKHALNNGADFVYLLNQDAYVFPDMFEHLLDAYADIEKCEVGILSPLHLYRDRRHYDCQFAGYLNGIAIKMAEDFLLSDIQKFYEAQSVPAAGWLLPRKTLEMIGGFDPIFFHYGEDHNYSQRVNYHSLKTFVVPAAKMIHDRDGYGNENMARKEMYFRTVKTEIAMNINLTKCQIILMMLKTHLKYSMESLKHICQGNFRLFKELQTAVPRNILYINRYRNHRKANKMSNGPWL